MNPLIILAGPTASGKSETALLLAEHLGSEIVSADSMQVYRHFDIGTAKPSREIRDRVKHHLINIVEPHEEFTAYDFKKHAEETIDRLHQVQSIPILVGGTGLYLKTLLEDMDCAAPVDANIRQEIREAIKRDGAPKVHGELKTVDPEAAKRIRPTDPVRIERALGVYRQTGKPLSSFHNNDTSNRQYETHYFIFESDRNELYERIHRRVDRMIAAGWIEEVEALLKKNWSPDIKPFQSIGYRQWVRHLQGDLSKEDAIDEIKQETRHYAKRQVTWFKKTPSALPVHHTASDNAHSMKEKILSKLPQGVAGIFLILMLCLASPEAVRASSEEQFETGVRQIQNEELKEAGKIFLALSKQKPSRITSRAGYMLGRVYLQQKDWQNAINQFRKALLTLPEIEDYIRLDLARALFELNNFDAAKEHLVALQSKYPDSRLIPQAEFLKADIHLKLKQPQPALAVLEQLQETLDTPEHSKNRDDGLPQVLFKLGQLHESMKVPARAYLAYRKLHTHFATHPETKKANVLLKRLIDTHKLKVPPLTPEEFSSRITGLLKKARYEKVLLEMTKYQKQNPKKLLEPEFYFFKATALKGLRKRSESIETLKQFLKDYPHHPKIQEARFTIGRQLWNLGRNQPAMKYFQTIKDTTSRSKWKQRMGFYIGRVYEDMKQFNRARESFTELIMSAPTSRFGQQAAWHLGWVMMKQEQWKEARKLFLESAEKNPDGLYVDKQYFWAAKLAEKLKQPEVAKKERALLAEKFPYTYYGLRAQALSMKEGPAHLQTSPLAVRKAAFVPEEKEVLALGRELTVKEKFHRIRAKELSLLGFYQDAREEARELEQTVRKNLSGTLWLSRVYMETGGHPDALRLLYLIRDLKTKKREKELPETFWKLFYPMSYQDEIGSHALEYELDPLFVNGLIRQESLFDAQALSPAGARGLMQIMPATGKRLFSPGKYYNRFRAEALFDPTLNIRLGVKYLGRLSQKFNNNGVHMLISYNAGPHVLEKWLKRFSHIKDEDLFIESIPYPETRGYVKHVLRNYGIYRKLYGPKPENEASPKSF